MSAEVEPVVLEFDRFRDAPDLPVRLEDDPGSAFYGEDVRAREACRACGHRRRHKIMAITRDRARVLRRGRGLRASRTRGLLGRPARDPQAGRATLTDVTCSEPGLDLSLARADAAHAVTDEPALLPR